MGRLVAQALHLIDQGQFMGLGVDGEAADAPYRIGLAGAIFVDHEQLSLIFGKGQPGRVFAFDHLQRLGVDLPGGAFEVQPIDALALPGGVRTYEQLIVIGASGLNAHRADAAGHQQRPEITHRPGHHLRCRR
ncbi:hypothetical protein D3C87_1127330 [compost metagenome]